MRSMYAVKLFNLVNPNGTMLSIAIKIVSGAPDNAIKYNGIVFFDEGSLCTQDEIEKMLNKRLSIAIDGFKRSLACLAIHDSVEYDANNVQFEFIVTGKHRGNTLNFHANNLTELRTFLLEQELISPDCGSDCQDKNQTTLGA